MNQDLKIRTKRFAVSIIVMTDLLPKKTAGFVIGRQVMRSATSVGANYRASLRGRSRAEFIAKLGIVVEEADETVYWLELLSEAKLLNKERVTPLLKEANELTAIFTAMVKKAKLNNLKNQK